MQVKKDDVRNKILTVAERMFIRNGYESTSLKMIADRSYISKSNIYRYFGSKEEIYDTLVESARDGMKNAINFFASHDYAGKYTPDKVEEISLMIAKLMCSHRSGFLIILSYSEGEDYNTLKQMFTDQFLHACPIEDDEFKTLIVNLLIIGFTDVLLKHDTEEEIHERLRLLWGYHYLGLNGVKRGLGIPVDLDAKAKDKKNKL